MAFTKIMFDLCELQPTEISLPNLILPTRSDEKFNTLYRKLQQKSRLKDHHQSIYIAYQLGKFLEEETILRTQKSLYRSQMTKHFYESSIRSYYIFEKYSIQQIFRTKNLTLTKIRRLKEKEFKFLLTDFSLEPQNLEEEY
jgi:hypothetical protein